MSKVNWYTIRRGGRESKKWLDGIEEKHGIRPQTETVVIACPDHRTHICSLTPATWVIFHEAWISNFHELEEKVGFEADTIEQELQESYWMAEDCWYENYNEFWAGILPPDWTRGQMIKLDGVEFVGAMPFDDMTLSIANDMARGDFDSEEYGGGECGS